MNRLLYTYHGTKGLQCETIRCDLDCLFLNDVPENREPPRVGFFLVTSSDGIWL